MFSHNVAYEINCGAQLVQTRYSNRKSGKSRKIRNADGAGKQLLGASVRLLLQSNMSTLQGMVGQHLWIINLLKLQTKDSTTQNKV